VTHRSFVSEMRVDASSR